MLKKALNCALLLGAAMTAELAGAGELTLYSRDDYHGRSQTVRDAVADLEDVRFNDTVQSVRVRSGDWKCARTWISVAAAARWVPASTRAWNA